MRDALNIIIENNLSFVAYRQTMFYLMGGFTYLEIKKIIIDLVYFFNKKYLIIIKYTHQRSNQISFQPFHAQLASTFQLTST